MYKPRPILKKYYDSLEESKILGMKCNDCQDVVWPPLPTCQKCSSTELDWIELAGEAIIEEFSFERGSTTAGATGGFFKGNPFFSSDEPFCLCTGRLSEGTLFNGALFGVNDENVDELLEKLPFSAQMEFIQLEGEFKSVGFRVK